MSEHERARQDILHTPLTLRERIEMRDLELSMKQIILSKGYSIPVILLALVNILADLVANFVADKEERQTRMNWIVTQFPFYVRAYEQKEKTLGS